MQHLWAVKVKNYDEAKQTHENCVEIKLFLNLPGVHVSGEDWLKLDDAPPVLDLRLWHVAREACGRKSTTG